MRALPWQKAKLGSKYLKQFKVELSANLTNGLTGKDVILDLIGKIGVDGARYMALIRW